MSTCLASFLFHFFFCHRGRFFFQAVLLMSVLLLLSSYLVLLCSYPLSFFLPLLFKSLGLFCILFVPLHFVSRAFPFIFTLSMRVYLLNNDQSGLGPSGIA